MSFKIENPSSVAFALITFYPKWYQGKLRSIKHTDKIRGDLALEFMSKAGKLGYRVVVADSQSPKTFRKELLKINDIILIKRRSQKRSPGKRRAIQVASKLEGVKVIILTEAEKVSLMSKGTSLIVKPILENKAEIVVPSREPELFKSTYPKYMYESELEGNRLYNEQLRTQGLLKEKESLDMFFGPKAFCNEPRILRLFMKQFIFRIGRISFTHEYFDPEELSNTTFFPIVDALKKKIRVQNVEIPFSYPTLQKDNEETGQRELFIAKRRVQRLGLLVELMHFISFLEHKKNSHLREIKR